MPRLKRTTREQRLTIEILKILFGEVSYGVCEVPAEFRRHRLDFVAYHRQHERRFVLVRPTLKGWVSITPFAKKELEREALRYIGEQKHPARVWWSKKQLRLPSGVGGWVRYFPPEVLEECRPRRAA